MILTNKEIYEWFHNQNFQTEYEETGEYEMCFVIDIPKIVKAFDEFQSKHYNEYLIKRCSNA